MELENKLGLREDGGLQAAHPKTFLQMMSSLVNSPITRVFLQAFGAVLADNFTDFHGVRFIYLCGNYFETTLTVLPR